MSGQSGFSGMPISNGPGRMYYGGGPGFNESTGQPFNPFPPGAGFSGQPLAAPAPMANPMIGGGNQLPRGPMSGGLGNQYSLTPPQGMSLPQSAQRMPGGFGLSPQLLQMIAGLQSRSPKFNAQAPVAPRSMFGGAWGSYAPVQNPYQNQQGRDQYGNVNGTGSR